jgi:predicted dinucleotide-binding enzyme
MRIGILGSGLMGGKLGTLFARAGHDVIFSYSHSEKKLQRLARDAGANARAGTPSDAARDADALLLSVPWSQFDDVLEQAGDLSGKVIVTCSLPTDADGSGLLLGYTTSGAEELAKKVPKARVVQAFNTVPSEVFFAVFENRRRKVRPSVVYCGDDKKAKRVAAQLISDVGFEPIDIGGLRMARCSEPFTFIIAQQAYETDRGPALAYRFEWYEELTAPSAHAHPPRQAR